ncbi:LOW QUALITY PROTEIN: hypothetical protein U9M48_043219 [Paspalum notatum var. saurae]|uniref:Reverse transcriptase Ty1/copia-type domain-containing protein n=1 Tax=Paspalum notatum var. saurae TaxID=547442 RepID=A0AAQ3XGX3_PASNO
MFSVCLCARFHADPRESHLTAVKRILRYLKHTPGIGLWYPKGARFELLGYSDADFAGCRVEQYLQGLLLARALACFVVVEEAKLLKLSRIPLLCDNESAIKLANNPVQHSRTKHIDFRHHFIRDHVAKGDILLRNVGTK